MSVIAGHDPLDPASADPVPIDFLSGLRDGVEGLKLALPRDFYEGSAGLDPEVAAALDAAVETLRGLGATVDIITLPDYALFNAAGRVIILAEAFAIHEANLRTRPRDYGRFTATRMMVGGLLSAADLTQAFRVRRKLSQTLNNTVLNRYDGLLAPATLAPAYRFDSIDPEMPPASPSLTMPFNLTGNPAMSVPTGLSAAGLPLSMQIVGRPFDDAMVLRIGQAFETATAFTARRPGMAALAEAA